MNRRSAVWSILSVAFAAGRTGRQPAPLPQDRTWAVRARYTDTCGCPPTCPCLFGSMPSLGYCEGITLIEIESGHFEGVQLDGVAVLAAYRGGEWMKFYVTNEADETQTEAVIKLLPAFEDFFASDNILQVSNAPISVQRSADRIKITAPDTHAEIEIMRGVNGQPIHIENLPAPGFPAPTFHEHTQYRSIVVKHDAADKQFEYSGTNGFTARIEAVAPRTTVR